MATHKTKKKTSPAPGKAAESRSAGVVLRETWDAAMKQLAVAEAELEKQVRSVLDGKGLGGDTGRQLRELGNRLERQRRKLAREIETRVGSLQERVKKESAGVSRMVDEAVRRGLAALNIPSRHEIADLTRKVDALTRKIDGVSSRTARRPLAARTATVSKPPVRSTRRTKSAARG